MTNEALNDNENDGAVKANEIMEKLGAYVDGELRPEEREDMETLLERDRSCREAVQWFRFLDDAARREKVPSVNAREWAAVWEDIQRRKELARVSESPAGKEHGKVVFVNRWFVGMAAAAAIVVLAFIGFRMMQPSDTAETIAQPTAPTTETPPAQEKLDKSVDDEEDSVGVLQGEAPDVIKDGVIIYRDF